MRFNDIPDDVFVGIPIAVGATLGKSLYDKLTKNEQNALCEAAKTIFQTYNTTIEQIE